MSLDNAVQFAAGQLPERWNILIDIEHHAGCVRLYDPDGDELQVPDADNGDLDLAHQVCAAVRFAIVHDELYPETPA